MEKPTYLGREGERERERERERDATRSEDSAAHSLLRHFPRMLFHEAMIDLNRISEQHLEIEPYRWAVIDELFSPLDAAALAATFPHDRFKRLSNYGGDKDSEYESRALIGMGAQSISGPEEL